MNDKLATVFECTFTPPQPSRGWSAERIEKWAQERAFYTGAAEFDVSDYFFKDEKTQKPNEQQLRADAAQRLGLDREPTDTADKAQAKNIAEYMTRFNTLGAFGLNGTMTKAELEEWQRNIKTTGSNIWHGYLSIPPSLSVAVTPEAMQRLCRATFGKFLEASGFERDNIALMCVVHGDTDHSHFHFAFYEKSPSYLDKDGRAKYRWRGKIAQDRIDDYRLSATAYIDEHKEDFFSYRDVVTQMLRSSKVTPSDALIYNALRELKDKLPRKGRLQYNSENMRPFRSKIDDIAIMMLKKNPQAYAQHKKALREIARRGRELGELKHTNDSYVKEMTAEYKGRLGNAVLKLVRQMQFDPKNRIDRSSRKNARPTKKQYKAAARRRRQTNKRVIDAVIRSLNSFEASLRTDFSTELHNAENEIENARRGVKK